MGAFGCRKWRSHRLSGRSGELRESSDHASGRRCRFPHLCPPGGCRPTARALVSLFASRTKGCTGRGSRPRVVAHPRVRAPGCSRRRARETRSARTPTRVPASATEPITGNFPVIITVSIPAGTAGHSRIRLGVRCCLGRGRHRKRVETVGVGREYGVPVPARQLVQTTDRVSGQWRAPLTRDSGTRFGLARVGPVGVPSAR